MSNARNVENFVEIIIFLKIYTHFVQWNVLFTRCQDLIAALYENLDHLATVFASIYTIFYILYNKPT